MNRKYVFPYVPPPNSKKGAMEQPFLNSPSLSNVVKITLYSFWKGQLRIPPGGVYLFPPINRFLLPLQIRFSPFPPSKECSSPPLPRILHIIHRVNVFPPPLFSIKGRWVRMSFPPQHKENLTIRTSPFFFSVPPS